MIEGVLINPLKTFSDDRGKVLHMLRSDVSFFEQFGEIYFSIINPGVIKGWKKHFKKTQHFAVPVGNIKLVIYDDRETSSTTGQVQEVFIGVSNYQLVRIPPLTWYSFKAIGNESAMVANCTDLPYDPQDVINVDIGDETIAYNWGQ